MFVTRWGSGMEDAKLDKLLGVGALILFAAVLAGAAIWAGLLEDLPATRPSPEPAPAHTNRHRFNPGDRVRVYARDEGPTVFMYDSLETYDAFGEAMRVKDELGVKQLILTGRMWMLASGTECLVLDSRPFRELYEVRVESGEQTGRRVFVAYWNKYEAR